ncbi:MAG: bifunctional alpha/beta hydrolase/OsmC family protein [Pseudomonadota bacterium]
MASNRQKVTFKNNAGQQLAGLLELPGSTPRAFALFAHCFTCGKDINSASRISRALAAQGIAVMRFDFTGLGSSDGDFANTNFSSNVEDLLSAAQYLTNEWQAPSIMIGHSLGGAAVLTAADKLPDVKAVVTIGAPATPAHVVHNFQAHLEEINTQGFAEVNLAGRPFTIKKQFLDDVQEQPQEKLIANLRRPLLVFHSPTDAIVDVDEARKIYTWAKHPKSFISLDKADHLLSKATDAQYVAETIAAWSKRYLVVDDETRPPVTQGQVLVAEKNQQFTRSIYTDHHSWMADEPLSVGGQNLGPDPYEMLLASLGACTSMTMRMYANRKKWPVQDIYVTLSHEREYIKDCEDCENGEKRMLSTLNRTIRIEAPDLTEDQKQRLLEIADKCPVHKTLENEIHITTEREE